jgi:hypothetical protein
VRLSTNFTEVYSGLFQRLSHNISAIDLVHHFNNDLSPLVKNCFDLYSMELGTNNYAGEGQQ